MREFVRLPTGDKTAKACKTGKAGKTGCPEKRAAGPNRMAAPPSADAGCIVGF